MVLGMKDIDLLHKHEFTCTFDLDGSNLENAHGYEEDDIEKGVDWAHVTEIAKDLIGYDIVGAIEYLQNRGYKVKVNPPEEGEENAVNE